MQVKTEKGIRLATTSGVIRMGAGTQRNLEGEYLRQALEKGAVPVGEGESKPESGAKLRFDVSDVELSEDERFASNLSYPRKERIVAAVRALIERNDPAVLTGGGIPRVRDVSTMIGDDVTRDEVDEALQKVT